MQMVREINKKDPEQWEYLICYTSNDSERTDKELEEGFNIVKGRTEAYKFIRDIIDLIDVDESFILSDQVKLDSRKSIATFMRYIVEKRLVEDTEVNYTKILEYVCDYEEEENEDDEDN